MTKTNLSTTPWEVLVAEDAVELAALTAEIVGRAIDEAVRERGVARIALSGASTPRAMHRKLGAMALPFDAIEWFWVDERAVPPSSPRSNFGDARADIDLDRLAPERVHRMEADDPDLEAAARRYERLLRASFGVASAVAFDVVALGVGDDGHTASLFPHTGAVSIDDRLVAAIPAEPAEGREGREARLTLTAPVLKEARLVVVLARGEQKRRAIAAAWSPGPEDEVPSRLVQRARGKVVWVLDREAYPAG